jgi:hypothetical protein
MATSSQAEAGSNPATGDTAQEERTEERAWFKALPPERQQELLQRRQMSRLVAAIAGTSWGNGISEQMRRGIADYCHRFGLDPMTELDWLGGGVYVNAEWYKRKLGELRLAGVIADHWLDQIALDGRLEALMDNEKAPPAVREKAADEHWRRMLERARKGVPEEAESAHVCYIVLPSGGRPVEGVKWGGNGTSTLQPRGGGGSAPNPIVENNATLSTESQAIRRAMSQLASHVTGILGVDPRKMDEEADRLNVTITATMAQDAPQGAQQPAGATERPRAGTEAQRAALGHRVPLSLPPGDPYAPPALAAGEAGGVPADVLALQRRLAREQGALPVRDEYDAPGGPGNPALVVGSVRYSERRAAPAVPGFGGTPLSEDPRQLAMDDVLGSQPDVLP